MANVKLLEIFPYSYTFSEFELGIMEGAIVKRKGLHDNQFAELLTFVYSKDYILTVLFPSLSYVLGVRIVVEVTKVARIKVANVFLKVVCREKSEIPSK